MTRAEFIEWVEFHVRATAADDRTLDALLANEEVVCGDAWKTTLKELKLATQSLVAHNKTPTFANEHLKAIGLELIELRNDRRREQSQRPVEANCSTCGGLGIVAVPHPRCVYNGRLVTYMRDEVDYGYVATVGVICEACPAGKAEWDREERRVSELSESEKRRRGRTPTLSAYHRIVHGADGVALLREHNAYLARQARGRQSEADRTAAFAAQFPGIARRAGIGSQQPEESIP